MSARQARTAQSNTGVGDPQRSEAFRSLRATIKFAAGERPVRTVLVVDVDRDEPSGVAEHLAMAFAEAGDRCVLIDTDARAAGERTAGFLELLAGDASIDEIARPAGRGELLLIGAGRTGSPDALAGDALSAALDRLTEAHGLAVLSTAPLPRYADALAIAPRVDAVIMVVTSGGTRRPRAVEARDALDRVGANILGVVMVEPKKRRFW